MEPLANKIKYLQQSDFFRFAPAHVIEQLAAEMEEMQIDSGENVFSKGEMGTAVYFLVKGNVRVHDGDLNLASMGEGEVFGEIGAICAELRTASVTAKIPCALLKLEKDRLFHVLNDNPEGALSVIRAMAEREKTMAHHVTDHALKARLLERELEIGRRIQSGFLPERLPQAEGWAFDAKLIPAREVAGDFYDLFLLEDVGCLAIVIGDVCDKGLGAALFMILFRSLLRSNAEAATSMLIKGTNDSNRLEVLRGIISQSIVLTNQYISKTHGSSSMFASVFFGIMDLESGELLYINAGHEPPMTYSEQQTIRRLPVTGPVIGLFTDIKHSVASDKLATNDILVGFTDGISEAKNRQGDEYSEDRLGELLTESALTTEHINGLILEEVGKFVGAAAQHDDMTLISIQRL